MRRLILAIVAVLAPVAANAQHNWYVERDDNTGCEKPQAFRATPQNVVSNLLTMGITTDPIVKHLADGSVVVGIQVPVSVQFPNGGGFIYFSSEADCEQFLARSRGMGVVPNPSDMN